ncbi:hypothetical protein PVAP13_9NG350514 [Panicum virgatum]|uniref:Uncharacterized protein n=1 Tax=Panicum virgatum TaxID=38727 RepID=A0A8T0MMV0_PANVG|nr:hypothetical protein PVAP13_9NG350514 [Panicum virgatum]
MVKEYDLKRLKYPMYFLHRDLILSIPYPFTVEEQNLGLGLGRPPPPPRSARGTVFSGVVSSSTSSQRMAGSTSSPRSSGEQLWSARAAGTGERRRSACGSTGGRRAGADPGCGGSTSGGGLGGSTSGGCGNGTSGLDGMVGISGADVQHRAGSGGGRRHGLRHKGRVGGRRAVPQRRLERRRHAPQLADVALLPALQLPRSLAWIPSPLFMAARRAARW